MMKSYKIYGLKLKTSDEIRYIGMTTRTLYQRLYDHKNRVFNNKNRAKKNG